MDSDFMPSIEDIKYAMLHTLASGKRKNLAVLRYEIGRRLALTPEQMSLRGHVGKPVYESMVKSAAKSLSEEGLIVFSAGSAVITEDGQKIVIKAPEEVHTAQIYDKITPYDDPKEYDPRQELRQTDYPDVEAVIPDKKEDAGSADAPKANAAGTADNGKAHSNLAMVLEIILILVVLISVIFLMR